MSINPNLNHSISREVLEISVGFLSTSGQARGPLVRKRYATVSLKEGQFLLWNEIKIFLFSIDLIE